MKWKKIAEPPSPELIQFHNDALWFSEHYNDLREQYPDQWVGVYGMKVVGTSPDGMMILDELQANGVPVGHVFLRYIHGPDDACPRVFGSSLRQSYDRVR